MSDGGTTVCVQQYLDALAGDGDPDPIVRELLARAAGRLQVLSASMLRRQYPRRRRPPGSARPGELVGPPAGGVVRARGRIGRRTGRDSSALPTRHMRWGPNDPAPRLDTHRMAFTPTAAGEVPAET